MTAYVECLHGTRRYAAFADLIAVIIPDLANRTYAKSVRKNVLRNIRVHGREIRETLISGSALVGGFAKLCEGIIANTEFVANTEFAAKTEFVGARVMRRRRRRNNMRLRKFASACARNVNQLQAQLAPGLSKIIRSRVLRQKHLAEC